MKRRNFLTGSAAAGASLTVATLGRDAKADSHGSEATDGPISGNLKQSVCQWCYEGMPIDDLCKHAKDIGLKSVEIIGPDMWPTVVEHGLTCAMANGPSGIGSGWNEVKNHDEMVEKSEELLPQIAELGFPNMILFSGNKRGLTDEEGLRNCAKGIERIAPLAESLGVTLCMELLNSKRDHIDYQCDHTPWGVELVKRVDSDRFRLLYDIYHMQIMEGDVIATIHENFEHIAHYHTGGVPGRNEIDETQELYYKRICQAIVNMGYTGYLGQEFIPKRDPMTSLRQAAHICDV